MQIFKLTPLDLKNHNWRASLYHGPLTVRAENEDRARDIACLALGIAAQMAPGMPVPCNPWDAITGTASCEPLENGDYDPEGEEAILSPAEYDTNWRR